MKDLNTSLQDPSLSFRMTENYYSYNYKISALSKRTIFNRSETTYGFQSIVVELYEQFMAGSGHKWLSSAAVVSLHSHAPRVMSERSLFSSQE